jgi:hypothetical protein
VVLAFSAAQVLVNVLRDTLGVTVRVLVFFVPPIVVHDVHGMTFGMRVDVDMRQMRAAFVSALVLFVLFVGGRFAGHVAAVGRIHEMHLLFSWFGNFAVLFGLRFVMRRLEKVAAALRLDLPLHFRVTHYLRMVATGRGFEMGAVLALKRAKIGRSVTGLRGAVAGFRLRVVAWCRLWSAQRLRNAIFSH